MEGWTFAERLESTRTLLYTLTDAERGRQQVESVFEWLIGDVLVREVARRNAGSWLSCGGPERTRISDLYRVKVAKALILFQKRPQLINSAPASLGSYWTILRNWAVMGSGPR